MKKIGIYLIKNMETGRTYFGGSTSGIGKKRKQHFQRLRTRKHPNRALQADYIKYGHQAFKFEVLHCCSPNQVLEMRFFYIHRFLEVHPKKLLYNSPRGASLHGYLPKANIEKTNSHILANIPTI